MGLALKKNTTNKGKGNNTPLLQFLNKDLLVKKIGSKQKEVFYLELFSMLNAGMDIKDSIDVIIGQQKKQFEEKIFSEIKQELIDGYSLSECLKRSNNFTPYEYYCVQIGEESGRIKEVLEELALYYNNKIKIFRQVMKSISYPIVILVTSIIATTFMITFIVPMFSEVFKRFGSDLPKITQIFIKISEVVKGNILEILAFIIIFAVILSIIRKKRKVIRLKQLVLDKIPFTGSLMRSVYLSRFCSAMALLSGAKVPLIQSINLVIKMIDYYPLKEALIQIEKKIELGISLHKSLSEHKIFDAKMIALLKVGEEVNKLDLFFTKLFNHYSEEVELKANAINTFLEPIIIMFLGFIIGIMLLAMYLPMFKLSGTIG